MQDITIDCPNCHERIPLTAAITRPIQDQLQRQFQEAQSRREAEMRRRELQLAEHEASLSRKAESVDEQIRATLAQEREQVANEQRKLAGEAVQQQLRDLQQQVQAQATKLADAQTAQLEAARERRELDEAKAAFELEKVRLLDTERERIRADAASATAEITAVQIQELQDLLAVKGRRLAEAESAELALRKERNEFEEQKRAFELELARRTQLASDEARKASDEAYRLKAAEKDLQLDTMRRQIDDLKRKAEQGSQQAQGEVLELDLEAALRRCFTSDEVVRSSKGTLAADLQQQVKDELGQTCGSITWESKRTKAWNDAWLAKARDDMLDAKAQIAVIVATTLPKDVPAFECREGIWIVPPNLAVPLAVVLRFSLMESFAARQAVQGRHDKTGMVYAYISGPDFKSRVTAMVDALNQMSQELASEKRTTQARWARREKQIERVMVNTAALYGHLSGIVGKDLPAIEQLELESAGVDLPELQYEPK